MTKQYGSLKIDLKAHAVYLHGKELSFIPRDLSLLLFFARYPNQTFTREQLIEQVWGIDYKGSDRAVDLSVKRIRKALEMWPLSEGELKTLRGLGYQLCVYEMNEDVCGLEIQELMRVFKDIVDRLRQLEAVRTELLIDATSKLKTPITSISILLQVAREGIVQGEEAIEFIEIYSKETEELLRTIEELLDFTSAD